MTTYNAINTGYLASDNEVKVGTDTRLLVTPSTFTTYTSDMVMTGFISWSAGGPYFDDTTLGTFSLLVGGTGYIKGKLISWSGSQDYTGMTAGDTYYIYIDDTGTIGAATSRTDALFEDYIVLFECMRDSTPGTNNQITVKENHPYNFQTDASNFLHNTIGPVIESYNNGANIAINGTQGVQIDGADVLADHGLETTIPDSGSSAVTWIKMYTDGSGKWARQNATNTFTGFYNNAGTPTALSANKYGIYTLYASKDNLNTSAPVYFAVLDTSQYNTANAADSAITAGNTATISNELAELELCRLGYIIYSESSNAIVEVIISKSTVRSSFTTSGSNQANLINTITTNFDGWLSSADTTVQAALDTLDDSQRLTEETTISANLEINKGVIANNVALVTLTLPTTASVGDTLEVVGKGAGGWLIAQNAGQSIHFISSTTTVGVGGSLASSQQYDAIKMVCTVADTEFTVVSSSGNITIV